MCILILGVEPDPDLIQDDKRKQSSSGVRRKENYLCRFFGFKVEDLRFSAQLNLWNHLNADSIKFSSKLWRKPGLTRRFPSEVISLNLA